VRVLFLTHRLPYAPNRGDRIRAFHILRTLAEYGDVDLLSLTHSAAEASHAGDLASIASRVETVRVAKIRNLMRAAEAMPTSRPLTHILLDSPRLRPTLARMVAERRPDVVLAYCSGMAQLLLEPSLREIPAIVDFVDVDSQKWDALARASRAPRRWIYEREHRLLSRFEAVIARHARASVVVNERERQSLTALAPDARVEVIQVGVDLDAFRPSWPGVREPSVVFCGVMNYEPNEQAAAWLIDAVWPLVRQARPDARLLIVGADPPRRLRARAERDATITVTGTVPDVRPYLWRSQVAVAPLAIARGVQTKVLEAVAAGAPVVVTTAVAEGLPREAMPACRVADHAMTFADEIIRLLAYSPMRRTAVARSAKLTALKWSERLAPLVALLQEQVEQGGQRKHA
jgi:sugar transferase (PEP-CTERM/EpsH1 system associated)